jgi:tetratricopeptide (TPR) repeat protein
MGVVYQARQRRLNRLVALKMILAGGHAGPEARARFHREAQALAQLRHPHILQIYEDGECDGMPFLALEYMAGGSLAARIEEVRPSAEEAAGLVQTLARAIHEAHKHGIVHRDLKPGNVLFDLDGTPKISDFGLAKRLSESGPTASNAIAGTPSYMAPEQAEAKSKPVGPAADVYGLGALLYRLLTGRPPFDGATTDILLQVVGSDPVRPRQFCPALPLDLEAVCLKCLRKKPEERYASALELAEDLCRFRKGEPTLARPVGRTERVYRWCRRNPVKAALATCITALTSVAMLVTLVVMLVLWQQPPYAERQLSRGLAEYRQRNYAQALDAFNTALAAKPDLAGGRFARARMYQKAREWAQAVADYEKVREPALQGESHACIAYCLIRIRQHQAADFYHDQALAEGVAPAVIYNNRAYSYLLRRRLDEAGENLDRALAIAPGMKAAWHNLALWVREVTLRGVMRKPDGPLPEEIRAALAEGLEAAERALELGPASGELHVDVARLMALARRDPDWAERALTHLEAAVQQGYHPGLWKDTLEFSDLHKHPRWRALMAQPATGPQPSTPRLVDPITD